MCNVSAISKGVDLLGVSVTSLCREGHEGWVVGEDTVYQGLFFSCTPVQQKSPSGAMCCSPPTHLTNHKQSTRYLAAFPLDWGSEGGGGRYSGEYRNRGNAHSFNLASNHIRMSSSEAKVVVFLSVNWFSDRSVINKTWACPQLKWHKVYFSVLNVSVNVHEEKKPQTHELPSWFLRYFMNYG